MLSIRKSKKFTSFLITAFLFTAMFGGLGLFGGTTFAATSMFQEFFEAGASAWTTDGGTWAVVNENGSNQYRQSDDTLGAFAYPSNAAYANWSDYMVYSKVTIKSVNTGLTGCQAGINARYQDPDNRYSFLLNATANKLEIRKKVSGTLSTMVQKSYTVSTNTEYALKGVLNGSTLEFWVNGVKELETTDTSFTTGRAALNTYGLVAQYDDVMVDSVDTDLFQDYFEAGAGAWSVNGGTWSIVSHNASNQYKQTNDTLAAFAYPSNAAYDSWSNYSVFSKVTIQSVNSGLTGCQAGLSARYTDSNNRYSFAMIASDNTLEIRKKVSGTLTTLNVKSYTVSLNKEYALKGVVNGSTLEFWVDGVKELETTDTSLTAGRAALNTYGVVGEYDDVIVYPLSAGPTPTPTSTPANTSTPTPTNSPTSTPTNTPTPTPSSSNYNVYFGNYHSHTVYSDGDGLPEDHFSIAKNNGFDFYMVSDHARSNYAGYTPENYEATKQAAIDYTDSNFVGMCGFEYSRNGGDGPGGDGHMNAFDTATTVNASISANGIQYFYDWLVDNNYIASYNHPSESSYNSFGYQTAARRNQMVGLSVINSGNLKYSTWLYALELGWKLAPHAGIDNHGTYNITHGNPYRTGILATSLTKANLMNGLRNRRAYTTWDSNLSVSMKVNNTIMGSTLSNPATLDFDIAASDPNTGVNGDKITKIEVRGDNGVLVTSQTFNAFSVTWSPSLSSQYDYYFISVYAADKTDGPTAYSSPIWTGR